MGRKRKHGKHLPRGIVHKHGAYYHVVRVEGKQRWHRLAESYSDALRQYADRIGKKADGPATVSDALGRYIALRAGELSGETIKGYEKSAKRLAPVFGEMRPEDLQREHVFRYVMDENTVSANRDRALISAAYTLLKNRGELSCANPAAGLNRRAEEKPRKRYITDDELATILASVPRGIGLIVRWAYLTGMRLGDILSMRISDCGKDGVTFVAGKTGKRGDIAWSDELEKVYKEAKGSRIGAQPLFRNSHGAHYTRDGFETIWQRAKSKCGVADLQFRDLRRKAGSDVSLDDAQALLQHSDPRITQAHYRAPKQTKPVK